MKSKEKTQMHILAEAYAGKPWEWDIFPAREEDRREWDEMRGEEVMKLEKAPYPARGLRDAKRREAAIEAWWGRLHPNALVALPTGRANDVWVLDIDVPSKDHKDDGREWLAEMEDEHGPLPHTRIGVTAGGGLHYYFKYVEGIANGSGLSSGLGRGVDVRGEGGYVVAPGSIMADGRFYEWKDDNAPFADAPDWLLDIVVKRNERPEEPRQRASSGSNTDYRPSGGNDAYARTALDAECRDLASMGEGSGRGFALNKAGFKLGSLVASGHLSYDEVYGALLNAAHDNGLVKTDGIREVEAKIRRGLQSGGRKPRDVPEGDYQENNLRLRDLKKVIERGLEKGKDREDSERGNIDADEDESADDEEELAIKITPFKYVAPKNLKRREFVYDGHYVRKYVSVTISPGGVGKTSLSIAEALAMTSGLNLLGYEIPDKKRFNVWLFNAEDPRDELERRIMACAEYFGLKPDDYEGRLFVDTGREQDLVIMREDKKSGLVTAEPILEAVVQHMKRYKIDVMIIDPFVSTHGVNENDNGAIDKVAKLWSQVADYTNCAVEIVHHAKKTGDKAVTVEDARGAVALLSAARSARVLNPMTDAEAKEAAVKLEDRRSYFSIEMGKVNLLKNPGKRKWRKLESVPLGNGTGRGGVIGQDHAGVVTEWLWPTASEVAEELDEKIEKLIIINLRNKLYKMSQRSSDWAGHMIGQLLGIETDKDSKDNINRCESILRSLHEQKKIAKVQEAVARRTDKQWFWTTPDVAMKMFEDAKKGDE